MTKRTKTAAGAHLSKIMMESYMDMHTRAQQGAFVIWIAIVVPAELFAGFDNIVYAVPESHAAMTAGKGVSVTQCQKAENLGYSMDLCSYARIDLGSYYDNGKDSPVFGLPKPDLIVSNNNNCSLLVKWFDVYHRDFGIPHFVLDVPFCYNSQREKDLDYIVSQFKDLIDVIEQLSGQAFDMEKVKKAASHTNKGLFYWKRFLSYARQKPSGITAFDSFVQMAPFFTLRGTPQFEQHYNILADETGHRYDIGDVPVPLEKYRLLWDNIAPWHQLRPMSKRLAEKGANIVGAGYTSCMGTIEGSFDFFEYTQDDPLRYLARCQNASMCPHGLALRCQSMGQSIEDLAIDGVVFASNRSCKVFSVMQMDQQKMIQDKYQVETVMIDVDHADARKYSEADSFLRIEALLEKIDSKRGA